ncbi:MAG: hypothetical protein ACOCWY_01070 [Thermodesulfobacteriota bacterium]
MHTFFDLPSRRFSLCLLLALLFFLVGCGGDSLPIQNIQATLSDAPSYSIILENMKEEGNFFKDHYHRYRVVQGDDAAVTDWLRVPEEFYQANEPFMGMVLAAKKEGENITEPIPPGYQYVGDTRYGNWRTDDRGRSFWEFYGKYALLSNLFGGWYRPVYRDDYDAYRYNRSRNIPYFGRNNQYGTSGAIVKQAKPDFYQRRMARDRLQSASFMDKVSKRVGRTRSNLRGRSGGRGK